MAIRPSAQIGMDDDWLEDAELEEVLEKREAQRAAYTEFNRLTRLAKARVEGKNLTPGDRRIGRFKAYVAPRAGGTVTYETKPGMTISFEVVTADEGTMNGS